MLDSFGREIRYLRVSVTDRCNLRCAYCMPAEGLPLLRHEEILSYEEIEAVVRAAVRLGFRKVRLTGGEPLARKGIEELVGMLRAVPGLETIAMTSNGTLLAPLAAELARRGLDSVNVSLDTMDPGRFAAVTRGGRLAEALAGIEAALAAGLPVKLNVVVLDSAGGAGASGGEGGAEAALSAADEAEVRAYAARVGARVQTIRRYRLDVAKDDLDIEQDRPPKCGSCDRLRLLADGRLRPCLHGESAYRVDFADVEGSLRRAIEAKPARGAACADLAVGQIGG